MRVFVTICTLALIGVFPVLAEEEKDDPIPSGHDPKDFDLVVWMMMESSVKEQNIRQDVAKMKILQRAYHLGLEAFLSTLKRTGLGALLKEDGPFTMFGITDQAFEQLPSWAEDVISENMRDLINFQIIEDRISAPEIYNDMLVKTHSGNVMRFNVYQVDGNPVYTAQCVRITRVEKRASNGIIHVQDGVMIPPIGTGIDTLKKCPIYQTLVKSPARRAFWNSIRTKDPWTVFAPTNKAFRELPSHIYNQIMSDADKMEQVIAYHIVPGTYCSAGLVTGNLTTASGYDLQVFNTLTDGLSVNGARLIAPDASVTNGVVHGIDTVLFPPDFEFFE